MPGHFLIDTDVLVEYLRGRERAIEFLEALEGAFYASAITVAELYSGVRDDEREAMQRFLGAFTILPVDEPIAESAGLCRRAYGPTHGTGLADAIVAKTAEAACATLITFNRRHFPMVEDLIVPYTG